MIVMYLSDPEGSPSRHRPVLSATGFRQRTGAENGKAIAGSVCSLSGPLTQPAASEAKETARCGITSRAIGAVLFCFVFMAAAASTSHRPSPKTRGNVIGGETDTAIASSPAQQPGIPMPPRTGRAIALTATRRPRRRLARLCSGWGADVHQPQRHSCGGGQWPRRTNCFQARATWWWARPGHYLGEPTSLPVLPFQSPGAGGPIGWASPAHRRLWPQRRSATRRVGRQAPGLDRSCNQSRRCCILAWVTAATGPAVWRLGRSGIFIRQHGVE